MRGSRLSKLPVVCFALAFVVAASTSALAAARWTRVAFGTGVGSYGGGSMGCISGGDANGESLDSWCPIVDNDTITAYTGASAWFANSNHTQPMMACVSFTNRTGDSCSSTVTNNCPSGGVCNPALNISAWQGNMGQFKYVVFDNLTSGAALSGYVVFYNTTI
jgi:hypothetical protein